MSEQGLPPVAVPDEGALDKPLSAQATPASLRRAAEIVGEIKALRASAVQFAQTLEAQLMERLWRLRQEFESDPGFAEFVAHRLGIAGPQALSLAATWAHARQHRAVRELAEKTPEQALRFVSEIAEQGGLGELNQGGDDEVARIMTLPPKQMKAALRELLHTPEVAVAEVAAAEIVELPPAARLAGAQVADGLAEVHRLLRGLAAEFAALASASQAQRMVALQSIDLSIGLLESACEHALDGEIEMPLAGDD